MKDRKKWNYLNNTDLISILSMCVYWCMWLVTLFCMIHLKIINNVIIPLEIKIISIFLSFILFSIVVWYTYDVRKQIGGSFKEMLTMEFIDTRKSYEKFIGEV